MECHMMRCLKSVVLVACVACAGFVSAAESFASWSKTVKDGSWRTGRLPAIAATYEARMRSNSLDYEARILHAASILAQLGENADLQAFTKKFGYTINYLGMELTGKTSAPSGWAKPNDMVDKAVSVAVPVLQRALKDLEGIPEDWRGTVWLSPSEYPVDEDVYVDIGDVLYARASLEGLIGTVYFLKGYDLPLDWTKAMKVVNTSVRSVPLLTAAPSLTSTAGWDQALKSKKDGKTMWVAFAGRKLYVRVASIDGGDRPSFDGFWLDFWNDSADAWSSISLYQNGYDEDHLEWIARCQSSAIYTGPWPDFETYLRGWDGEDWDDYERRFQRFEAARIEFDNKTQVTFTPIENDDSFVLVFDLSTKSAVVKGGYWETCAEVEEKFYGTYWVDGYWYWDDMIGTEVWVSDPHEEEGWRWRGHTFSFDADGLKLKTMQAEQTGFAAKLRDAGALSTSKTWVRAALSTALRADEAVLARPEYDGNLHFIEYDKLSKSDVDAIDKARRGTAQALAALDGVETVDAASYADRTPFDTTLLPNEGVFQVYLGALFSGKITRDLLPRVEVDEYGAWHPIAESFKDTTIGGLFPEFTVGTWKGVFSQFDIEMGHEPITIKLDANGGKVGRASYTLEFDNDGEFYYFGELPRPNDRAGYAFAGWFTSKADGLRVYDWDTYEAAFFAGQTSPTLYAHWIKAYTVTLKDDSAYLEYYNETYGLEGCWEGKGVVSILEGSTVHVDVDSEIETRTGHQKFQKWNLSPSTAAMGPSFRVGSCGTEFTMPAANLTLQAAYANYEDCGFLYVYPEGYSSVLGDSSWYNPVELDDYEWVWDEEYGDYRERRRLIEPAEGSLQWSPDGGKTWYGTDEAAMLKAGKYTVTFRSQDASWQEPKTKYSATVYNAGDESYVWVYDMFSFIPVIVADVLSIRGGELDGLSGTGGAVTINPKDGRVLAGKTVTLTAKAAKDYAFQGWVIDEWWEVGDRYLETSATYKLDNTDKCAYCGGLTSHVNPNDGKVHVKAVFRHLSDYRPENLVFNGLEGWDSSIEVKYDAGGNASVDVYACVGCALDNLELDCGPEAYPLTYKLNGKLPAGLKFDAKTGRFTGAPTKAGDAVVTVTAVDPAKNSADLTVRIHVRDLPGWVAGEFRALVARTSWQEVEISEEEALANGYWWSDGEHYYGYAPVVDGPAQGVLEVSVGTTAKVSAKFTSRGGTASYSGQLTWYPDEEDPSADGWFCFNMDDTKKGWIDISLEAEGMAFASVGMYFKNGKEENEVWGSSDLVQWVKSRYQGSAFQDRYYTFAFRGAGLKSDYEDDWGYGYSDLGSATPDTTGYGYLTIKTDKTGIAKVVGMLPDGEKVSTSGAVLVDETGAGAHVHVFASPTSYKKNGQFVADLVIGDSGSVEFGGAVDGWRVPTTSLCWEEDGRAWLLDGTGAEYGAVSDLEGHYWRIFCGYNESVRLEYSYKEYDYTAFDEVEACSFGGAFFDVALKGDAKGGIVLESKSPAPWKQTETWTDDYGQRHTESWYNYYEDKKGNAITDPSQLSVAFTKATGIFSGKASVYFDYWQPNYKKDRYGDYYDAGSEQHKTASLSYTGVMVSDGYGLTGFGAAVYSSKFTRANCETGKAVSVTEKVSLPVVIEER